jgi:hypothetical protein
VAVMWQSDRSDFLKISAVTVLMGAYGKRWFMQQKIIISAEFGTGLSQWPRGVRHELSAPARTLGSWVRIPLETWMSVCVYSVCVVLCDGLILRPRSPTD